ncbi:MAG: hypothetical protein ABEL76_13590 [Bradymonadaceae bacterium]
MHTAWLQLLARLLLTPPLLFAGNTVAIEGKSYDELRRDYRQLREEREQLLDSNTASSSTESTV